MKHSRRTNELWDTISFDIYQFITLVWLVLSSMWFSLEILLRYKFHFCFVLIATLHTFVLRLSFFFSYEMCVVDRELMQGGGRDPFNFGGRVPFDYPFFHSSLLVEACFSPWILLQQFILLSSKTTRTESDGVSCACVKKTRLCCNH